MKERGLVRGARVLLRYPRIEDADAFLARVKASRRLHKGWVQPPSNYDQFMNFVLRSKTERQHGLLVCKKDDGELVGLVALSEVIRGVLQSCFVGFYAFHPHERQGYMTEGLQATLRFAFRDLRLHRVEANIQPDNPRSLALAARCGFKKEGFSPRYLKLFGRWRDHERWAILVDDWKGTGGGTWS